MATKDNSGGFLSRMVNLIRKPAELEPVSEVSEMAQESELNKLALKDRIERKRQDDIVRRREFNHLRKLRNDGPLTGRYIAGQRADFQHSTGFNPEDRALTVKKINAIEAQLSKHWNDLKHGDTTAKIPRRPPTDNAQPDKARSHADPLPAPPHTTTRTSVAAPPPKPKTRPVEPLDEDSSPLELLPASDFMRHAAPMPVKKSREPVQHAAPAQAKKSREPAPNAVEEGISGFSNSLLRSVDLGDVLGDPSLQDAAMRFAEGDDEGSEAVLVAVIQESTSSPESVANCAAALFDLYRATGQQASFDVVAMDFAQRFGRSPPEWLSTPELLASSAVKPVAVAAEVPMPVAAALDDQGWMCPPELDVAALRGLLALLAKSKTAQHLNWSRLAKIQPDATQELGDVFAQWCLQPIKLLFSGGEVLQKILSQATPVSDKSVDPLWWQVRWEAMRVLNLPDEFETVALDYCVLYEVSPPSWVAPKCEVIHQQPGGEAGEDEDVAVEQPPEEDETVVLELHGEVLGDVEDVLVKFQNGLNETGALAISCATLIRVDFPAATSILNWVAMRESQGFQVQFIEVPRLVASFFTVMGISDHAKITLRTK